MFIGHFGAGLAAKKAAPRVSLGTYFLAVQFLDLLWPTFLLLGWEHVEIDPGNTSMTPLHFTHYPYSHSLVMAVAWGLMVGLIYYFIKRNTRNAIVVGFCVLSHWVLDLLVHGPDLPLYPGNSPLVGLGLWNHTVLEIIVEGSVFIVGVILYLRTTRAKNKTGVIAIWSLIGFLIFVHLGNLSGTPPPNVNAIAWVGQSQWLLVIWAYWADGQRELAG